MKFIITQFISEQRWGLIHFIRAAVWPEGANGFVNWVLILSLIFLWPSEAKNKEKSTFEVINEALSFAGCVFYERWSPYHPHGKLLRSWGQLRSWRLSVAASSSLMLTLHDLTSRGRGYNKKCSSCLPYENLLGCWGCPRPWRLLRALSILRSCPISAASQFMRSDI